MRTCPRWDIYAPRGCGGGRDFVGGWRGARACVRGGFDGVRGVLITGRPYAIYFLNPQRRKSSERWTIRRPSALLAASMLLRITRAAAFQTSFAGEIYITTEKQLNGKTGTPEKRKRDSPIGDIPRGFSPSHSTSSPNRGGSRIDLRLLAPTYLALFSRHTSTARAPIGYVKRA